MVLCGVCSLVAQLRQRRDDGASPAEPVFPGVEGYPAQALARLRRRCAALGFLCGWHAFRRGMASDMLNSGSTIAQILMAGGWRSAAFLRYLTRRDVDERALHEVRAGLRPQRQAALELTFDFSEGE